MWKSRPRVKIYLKFYLKSGVWTSVHLKQLSFKEAQSVMDLIKEIKPGDKEAIELIGDGTSFWINYEDVVAVEMKVRKMAWYEYTR